MKKLMIFLGMFYCGMISSSFASNEQLGFDNDFKKINQDTLDLAENVNKLQSCFRGLEWNLIVSKDIVRIFEEIGNKTKKDEKFKSFLDNFTVLICEEKVVKMGIFSVDAIQEKFINPLFVELFKKPTIKTWETSFKEVFIFNNEEYFEVFKLPYHQLLLKFFFDQDIKHDFYFLKSNLYQAIVSTSNNLLSLKLLKKREFSLI